MKIVDSALSGNDNRNVRLKNLRSWTKALFK